MKVTIKDIAKAAGVSVGTVSMALNNRKGVSEDTRAYILKVAEELHYVPNFSARSLVTRQSSTIGLLVPEIVNPYYSAIVDIMSNLSQERGYTLLLGISGNEKEQEKKYIEGFASRNALGVILVPMLRDYPNTDYLQTLKNAHIPMVFCTDSYPDWSYGKKDTIPCVMTDFKKGQYEMTRHLLRSGHRRICFVNVDMDVQFATLRQAGYVAAHEEAGHPVEQENFFYADHPGFEEAYQLADKVLERKPDAIACINDLTAIGLIKRMIELGVRIPEDVAVAGYDNMLFSELAQKAVSTVHQPLNEICERTMNILEDRIERGIPKVTREDARLHLIEPHLVLRETTRADTTKR